MVPAHKRRDLDQRLLHGTAATGDDVPNEVLEEGPVLGGRPLDMACTLKTEQNGRACELNSL